MERNEEAEIIGQGNYIRLVRKGGWEYAERLNICGIVGIVAITDENNMVLVEQYRPAVKRNVIELPAGLAGDGPDYSGEELVDAAHRELFEETGYNAESMEFLCEGPPSSGMTNEIITLFMARQLTKIGTGGGDETEDLIVHEIPVYELDKWLQLKRNEGSLIDLRIYTGLYFINKSSEDGGR